MDPGSSPGRRFSGSVTLIKNLFHSTIMSSLLRRQESSPDWEAWIPACAGMTFYWLYSGFFCFL